MPVTGHLFAGLATGVSVEKLRGGSLKPGKAAITVSVVVILSYLPDIVSGFFLMSGWSFGGVFSHSVAGGVCISLVSGVLLEKAGIFSFRAGSGIALFSSLFHDLLDFFHSSDRMPFWPFYSVSSGFGFQRFFASIYQEFLFYAVLYCLFLLLFYIRQGKQVRPRSLTEFLKGREPAVWGHRGVTFFIVIAAVSAGLAREKGEIMLHDAKLAITGGRYGEALTIISEAEMWPSTAKPGRLSYLKAQAYLKLGKTRVAEKLLLKSFGENPDYFWCVLDLAKLYASSELPVSDRRRLSWPYVERLKSEFSEREGLAAYLEKVEKIIKKPL